MNSMYPYAMIEKLPAGGFHWLTKNEISALDFDNIVEESDMGYVLEVDMEYPTMFQPVIIHCPSYLQKT